MASQQGLLAGNLGPSILAAGFWNYLREDITFSLFQICPLKMDLESIPVLSMHDSDHDYLNSISLILGKIVNAAFDHELVEPELENALYMIQEWKFACPRRLQPYSRGDGLSGTVNALPSVWFLQPCHGNPAYPSGQAYSLRREQLRRCTIISFV